MRALVRLGVWGLLIGGAAMGGMALRAGEVKSWDPAAARRIQMLMRSLRTRAEGQPELRSLRLTEHEVNSYLNLIYRQRYFPALREIRLHFQPPNKVAGTFDLQLDKSQMMGLFLTDGAVRAAFKGRLEIAERQIRFQFDHLDINGRNMDLGLLDSVFQTVQPGKKGGTVRSIGDWFRLLPGTRGLEVGKGFLLLYR